MSSTITTTTITINLITNSMVDVTGKELTTQSYQMLKRKRFVAVETFRFVDTKNSNISMYRNNFQPDDYVQPAPLVKSEGAPNDDKNKDKDDLDDLFRDLNPDDGLDL